MKHILFPIANLVFLFSMLLFASTSFAQFDFQKWMASDNKYAIEKVGSSEWVKEKEEDGFKWVKHYQNNKEIKYTSYHGKYKHREYVWNYSVYDTTGKRIIPEINHRVKYIPYYGIFECEKYIEIKGKTANSSVYSYYTRSGKLIGKSEFSIYKSENGIFQIKLLNTGEYVKGIVLDGIIVAPFVYNSIKYENELYYAKKTYSSAPTTIYNSKGLLFGSVEKIIGKGNQMIFCTPNALYDKKGNMIAMGKLIDTIGSDYLKTEIDKKMGLYDYKGNKIIEHRYYSIKLKDNFFFVKTAYSDGCGVIGLSGETIISPEYKEIIIDNTNKCFKTKTSDGKWGIIDFHGKMILDNAYYNIEQKNGYYYVETSYSDGCGILDLSGKTILLPKYREISFDVQNKLFKVKSSTGKYGMYYHDGKEILAPEFQECKVFNDDLIGFKTNGYWGVVDRVGKVKIPTNRAYTSIEYNRTFNKFYFTKEGGYKGECDASGKQTSITKIPTQQPKPTTSTTHQSTQQPTNSTPGNKSSSIDNNPGLLYKGEYTWGAQARVNGNLYSGGMSSTSTIAIYEDYLESETGLGLWRHEYKGTNGSGERMYKGTSGFGGESTVYVSRSYNIRMVVHTSDQWGNNNTEYRFDKGKSFFMEQGGNNGGYTPSSSSSSNNNTTTNPVQPHQRTKDCNICHGSGKCETCNGKHWYYGISGTKLTCPNCTPNGACSSCGGSGKKTVTEYY